MPAIFVTHAELHAVVLGIAVGVDAGTTITKRLPETGWLYRRFRVEQIMTMNQVNKHLCYIEWFWMNYSIDHKIEIIVEIPTTVEISDILFYK